MDLRTLALLYALMIVVAGLRKAGIFSVLAQELCRRARTTRTVGLLLVGLCFFSSMLITNDVALLTFVPFAIVVLTIAGQTDALIPVIVLQTVAANLGSMLTPVGNPQNLYLYSRFDLSLGEFLTTVGPAWGVSLLILAGICLLFPRAPVQVTLRVTAPLDRRELWVCLALLAVCLLTVLRILPWPAMLAIVIGVLWLFDREVLAQADFMLLLTFVAFFVFSGNLARMEGLSSLLRNLLDGHTYLTALLTSQVISNVPAALLLSGFTSDAHSLLLGVDIGGLGTPIASLASLISLKLYSACENARTGRFLLVFTGVNVLLLLLLSAGTQWI